MPKPLLQIALDATDLDTALKSAEKVSSFVDVIEVGTILAFSEGIGSVRALRERFPTHIIVCDMKITDASAILTKMALVGGANWVTVSAAAHIDTIRAAHKSAVENNGEIQIELYGHWTMEDARSWHGMGITQAIYHRSRDAELAGATWTDDDLFRMKQLSDIGIELSITGGILPQDIHLFKDIQVKSFIAGRALVAEDGKNIASAFHKAISENWNK